MNDSFEMKEKEGYANEATRIPEPSVENPSLFDEGETSSLRVEPVRDPLGEKY
jgi:hypothetical protein